MASSSVAESKESEPQTADPGLNFKTGQRYPTPSPGSGDRVFYETLLTQKASSEMAQDWCVAYGVLDEKQAAKLYDLILNRKGKKSVSNSPAAKKKPRSEAAGKAAAPSKARKIRDDDDFVGDTGMDASSAWEGRGTSGI
jgi:hypothetical protein